MIAAGPRCSTASGLVWGPVRVEGREQLGDIEREAWDHVTKVNRARVDKDHRLGYVHQDGRVAIMIMRCNPECIVDAWNGVDFPFGH